MVVDANGGYVWDGTTLTKITDTDLPSASSLTYQDGYFIVSTKNSMQFQISSLYEPTEWDATEFASKEAYSDNLRLVYSHNRDLWLFGSESTEIWFNSGATFPFERYQGGVITIGCKAPKSVASNDEAVFFLDNDLRVRMGVGVQTTVVSTPQIDYQISILSDWDQARGFCYIQDGHSFYQITISNKTLVYDVSTKFWHTRATGTSDARHPANCYAYFDNKHLVGHRDNGRILYFNPDEYTNNNEVMRAIRSCQSIHRERKNIFHHSLELEFEAGVGLSVNHPTIGSGVDPQAMLQWSDDGGKTWSNEVWTDIGALGKYKTRAIWRRLGVSRDRIYKVVISDPIKRVIISANLEATPGVA
jgi:hypothetical protein